MIDPQGKVTSVSIRPVAPPFVRKYIVTDKQTGVALGEIEQQHDGCYKISAKLREIMCFGNRRLTTDDVAPVELGAFIDEALETRSKRIKRQRKRLRRAQRDRRRHATAGAGGSPPWRRAERDSVPDREKNGAAQS